MLHHRSPTPRLVALVSVLALAGASASCIDPVHDQAVADLGPEAKGVKEGEKHRPGQPCLTCHGGLGPGPDFVAAGTVYLTPTSTTGVEGVTVILNDAAGKSKRVETNEVGNFYIKEGEKDEGEKESKWNPVFPLSVRIEYGKDKATMYSRIGRNAGCGSCHKRDATGGPDHMPRVYVRATP